MSIDEKVMGTHAQEMPNDLARLWLFLKERYKDKESAKPTRRDHRPLQPVTSCCAERPGLSRSGVGAGEVPQRAMQAQAGAGMKRRIE